MADPKDWIAISLLPGVGPAKLSRLFHGGWTPSKLLAVFPHTPFPLSADAAPLLEDFVAERGVLWTRWLSINELIEAQGLRVLTPDDPDYPPLLLAAPDHPIVLFVKGNVEALHLPMIALVGSRHASTGGLRHAYSFAKALSNAGFVVASGLALGIDGEAHRAAVELHKPTVAVMGTGIDQVYPAKHRGLAQAILDNQGALVTELLPGSPPLAPHFPRRNRIISGLSTGVLVVEAALKSGSLITARQAMDQGREVFALPGSIDHPGSRGCHALIRQGATLVESMDHMLEELKGFLAGYSEFIQEVNTRVQGDLLSPQDHRLEKKNRVSITPVKAPVVESDLSELDEHQQVILRSVEFALTYPEDISLSLGMPHDQFGTTLVELELLGWLEATSGGYRRVR